MAKASAFDEWLLKGVNMGWCSEPVCLEHNEVPLREWEVEALVGGEAVCPMFVRLWHDGTETEARTLWEVFGEAESVDD